MLEIPMVDVITDGIRLEGRGVDPDIVVKPAYDDNGRDLQLEKALEVVAKQIEQKKA